MNKEDWEVKRLGEVIDFQNGFAFQSSKFKESGTPIIRIGNIQNGNINIEDVVFCKKEDYKENLDKYIIKYDDILIAMSGATTGKVGISKFSKEFYLNQRVGRIRTLHDIATMYIYYFLQIKAEKTLMLAEGAAQPNISTTQIKNFLIPIPPLHIQTQIVAELDELNAILDKKRKQLEELDTLAQATFYDMFGDPVLNDKGWEKGAIKDTVSKVSYGTSSPATESGKYKYLRMNNITYTGYLDLNNLKYIDIDKKNIDKYIVTKGDILFNRTNSKELVGKTAVFNEDENMIIAGYLIRIRTNSNYNPYYIWGHLNSSYGKLYLRNICKSIIGMANINAKELQSIPILLPPLPLQHQFADRIEAIEAQKELINQSIEEVQLLFDYTMDKYFN